MNEFQHIEGWVNERTCKNPDEQAKKSTHERTIFKTVDNLNCFLNDFVFIRLLGLAKSFWAMPKIFPETWNRRSYQLCWLYYIHWWIVWLAYPRYKNGYY